jgi:hypothetical protein
MIWVCFFLCTVGREEIGGETIGLSLPFVGGVGGRPVEGRRGFDEFSSAFSRGFLNMAAAKPIRHSHIRLRVTVTRTVLCGPWSVEAEEVAINNPR